ncbi:hypothetical protein B0H21DRAFT_755499 [Amylocystis lapponica]|nr:hypothetical protein B0H21DRAFT_755499 [Amylocystis lapponica]
MWHVYKSRSARPTPINSLRPPSPILVKMKVMQRILVPTSSVPAEFVVPEQYTGNLEYAPFKGDPMKASTILPTMYFYDYLSKPWLEMKHLPCYGLRLPPLMNTPAERNKFVRRFDGNNNEWGPWVPGTVVTEIVSHRLAGPVPSLVVRFKDQAGQERRETFIPFLKEVCRSLEPEDRQHIGMNHYGRIKKLLNMVYIPILTNTVGIWPDQPERDKTLIYYMGEVLWVNETWTEYHVHVFNGPYAGLVMRSSHACAFHSANQAAIQKTPDACVYDPRLNMPEDVARILLPVEPTKHLVLPVGHRWTTMNELRKSGVIPSDRKGEANLEAWERDRLILLRVPFFDKLAKAPAECSVHTEWW